MGLLRRGAVLVVNDNAVRIYRTADTRYNAIGIVDMEMFETLQTGAQLRRLTSKVNCYAWNAELIDLKPYTSSDLRSGFVDYEKQLQGMPPRICKLLSFEQNDRKRLRLAKAALRFLHDFESAHRGGQFTMNWDFVPRGSQRIHLGGNPGSGASVNARKALKVISEVICQEDFDLLLQRLVLEKSASQLCKEQCVGRREIRRKFSGAMAGLANAYDRFIPLGE